MKWQWHDVIINVNRMHQILQEPEEYDINKTAVNKLIVQLHKNLWRKVFDNDTNYSKTKITPPTNFYPLI